METLKPGSLCRLRNVHVSFVDGKVHLGGIGRDRDSNFVPTGTLALLLWERDVGSRKKAYDVMTADLSVGWVYIDELELLSEMTS